LPKDTIGIMRGTLDAALPRLSYLLTSSPVTSTITPVTTAAAPTPDLA
jgi:hypothetical protein